MGEYWKGWYLTLSNNVSDKKLQPHKPDAAAPKTTPGTVSDQGGVTSTGRQSGDALKFVAPTHGGVDILKLLTELEDQIENTPKKMGMMFRFDEDKFHMTIMKIRANLPEEMKRASKLARDQERIVEETLENAERIKEDARKVALVEMERGKKEAGQLREQARMEADKQRLEANSEAARLTTEANTALDMARDAAAREAGQILAEAREHGRQLVVEARQQAALLVNDNDIVQQAQIVAQDLQLRAETEAQAVRRGADEYARDVLINLENVLGKASMQVQRGREMLEKPRG